jgi:cytochrome c5
VTLPPFYSLAAIVLSVQIFLAEGAAAAGKSPDETVPVSPATPRRRAETFDAHCGVCHRQMRVGVLTSMREVSEQRSQPARRRGLDAVFIKYVVRNGIGGMPPQTRVDVTDADLEAIVAYLSLSGAK